MRKKGGISLLFIIFIALGIGLLIGLTLMSSTMPPTQQPSTQLQHPQQPAQISQNTVVVEKQPSPFTYENTSVLQRPPAQPFYQRTRGEPSPYNQLGILVGEEHSSKGGQLILPLIGRQVHAGSSRYHYYTSTDGYHPMKLPVEHNKRTCNDNTGCDEIFSGNLVRVKGYDIDFEADMYPSPGPVYVV
jgi:hypothetical protein